MTDDRLIQYILQYGKKRQTMEEMDGCGDRTE